MADAIAFAVQRFTVEALKKEQENAIRAFLSGKDVFVSLPTGYGKSHNSCTLVLNSFYVTYSGGRCFVQTYTSVTY